MVQVIFWRRRRGLRLRDAKHRACAVVVLTDVGVISDGQQRAARTYIRKSGQDAGCRPRGEVRCPESPACNALLPGLRRGHVTRRKSGFRCLVTLTLQRRNAKNIFAKRMLRTRDVSSRLACNVAQSASKFHKKPAVSDAVETLNDCMMLNRNRPTRSQYWPVRTGLASRTNLHDPGACWQRNEDGGAP